MWKIQLLTRSRDFVTEVEIPPFVILPDVIQWGSRFFIHEDKSHHIEGMTYFVSPLLIAGSKLNEPRPPIEQDPPAAQKQENKEKRRRG